MPQYSKTTWVDGSAPAINASNLNKMESGIFDSIRQDGSTSMSAQLVVIAGTATTPSISPTGDTNNGIFFPATDVTAIATAGSERFRISSAGDVGIGTTSPTNKLTIANVTANTACINARASTTSAQSFGIALSAGTTTSDYAVNIRNADQTTQLFHIQGNGYVGVGTATPSYQFQVSTDSAAKPSTNTWTIASDARIKNVTGEYTKGLDAVCALRPVTYEYNGKAGFVDDHKENISIIAQEAILHFPECVGTFFAKLEEKDETETELYNWNGHAITFALINAVKELKAEVDSLKVELKALKG
jgi:hypothetical protein